MWSPEQLKEMHAEDEFAYQRGMQMIRVSDKDCIFHTFHWYITDTDPLLKEAPEPFLESCHLVKRSDLASWSHVAGFDLAFTPAEKAHKGTSRTAGTVVAVNPYSKVQYVRWSDAQYVDPSEHETYIEQTWQSWHRAEVVLETDKTVSELEDRLRDAGMTVDVYVPLKFGPKKWRKHPLAVAINNARVLLPGRLARDMTVSGGWTVEPMPFLENPEKRCGLLDDLKIFPAKCGDALDSLEIASRMAEEYYGGPEEEQPKQKHDPVNEFKKWRDAMYEDDKADEGEFAEALLALGDGSEDLALSGLMDEGHELW